MQEKHRGTASNKRKRGREQDAKKTHHQKEDRQGGSASRSAHTRHRQSKEKRGGSASTREETKDPETKQPNKRNNNTNNTTTGAHAPGQSAVRCIRQTTKNKEREKTGTTRHKQHTETTNNTQQKEPKSKEPQFQEKFALTKCLSAS